MIVSATETSSEMASKNGFKNKFFFFFWGGGSKKLKISV